MQSMFGSSKKKDTGGAAPASTDATLKPNSANTTGPGGLKQASVVEMLEYVKGLDIDPVKEADMLWIAEEAFNAALPPGWTEHQDEQGRTYFHNTASGDSVWRHPMDELFRDIVEYQRRVVTLGGFWEVEDEIEALEESIKKDLADWMELFDEQTERFFYNKKTDESRFDDPRMVVYHELYARIKMVGKMKERLPVLARNARPTEVELAKTRQKDDEERRYIKMLIRIQSMARIIIARRRVRDKRAKAVVLKGPQPLRGKLRLRMERVGAGGGRELVLAVTTPHKRAKAATKIQARARGIIARKRIRPLVEHRIYLSKLVTKIQKRARVWLARRKVARKRVERKFRAAANIQRIWRGHHDRYFIESLRAEKLRFEHMRNNVVIIQCGVRMALARRRVKKVRVQHKSRMIGRLQSQIKIHRSRLLLRELQLAEEPVQAKMAITRGPQASADVQWCVQLWCAPWVNGADGKKSAEDGRRRRFVNLFENVCSDQYYKVVAAVRMQALARGVLHRKKKRDRVAQGANLADEIQELAWELSMRRKAAATKIQKVARGRQCRKKDLITVKTKAFLSKNVGNVRVVQAYFARYAGQEWVRDGTHGNKQSQAATAIQARCRGNIARSHVKTLWEETVWPLKSWFEFFPTSSDSVQMEVRFVTNPRFDDFKYFMQYGERQSSLAVDIKDMLDEVALCVDKYHANAGDSASSGAAREEQKELLKPPGSKPGSRSNSRSGSRSASKSTPAAASNSVPRDASPEVTLERPPSATQANAKAAPPAKAVAEPKAQTEPQAKVAEREGAKRQSSKQKEKEPKVEVARAPNVEASIASKSEPAAEQTAEPKREERKPEAKAKPEPKAKAEQKARAESKGKAVPKAEAEPKPEERKPEPEAKAEQKTKAAPKTEAAPQAKEKPAPKPKSKAPAGKAAKPEEKTSSAATESTALLSATAPATDAAAVSSPLQSERENSAAGKTKPKKDQGETRPKKAPPSAAEAPSSGRADATAAPSGSARVLPPVTPPTRKPASAPAKEHKSIFSMVGSKSEAHVLLLEASSKYRDIPPLGGFMRPRPPDRTASPEPPSDASRTTAAASAAAKAAAMKTSQSEGALTAAKEALLTAKTKSYGGSRVGKEFVRSSAENIDDMTEAEKEQCLLDIEMRRQAMQETLKVKKKVHKENKKRYDEARQERYRNEMGDAEGLEEERRGRKVKELKKWLKMKEDQVRERKAKEDAVITDVLQRETAKAEAKKLLDLKGQEERERRLKAGQRHKAQLEEQMLYERAQRAEQRALAPIKHQQSQDSMPPGGYPPQMAHPTSAPANMGPPQQRVVHRHIHHHVHYHEGGNESEVLPEGMVAPGEDVPNVSTEDQKQIEMASEARIRTELAGSGQVPMGQSEGQHFHSHLGMPMGVLPDQGAETPASMRQGNSTGAMALDDQERTQEAFYRSPAVVAPSMSAELQAQGKKRGLKKYAGNVEKALSSYSDCGRPKLVRPNC